MANQKFEFDLSQIKNENYQKAINNALLEKGLKLTDLKNQINAKAFVETFTEIICKVILLENNFGPFRYPQLVTQEGEVINGTHILFRGKDLATAKKIKACELPDSCNLTLNQSKQYENKVPIELIEVSDVINKYCNLRTFCSDVGIQQFINAIRNDLMEAFTQEVEMSVEQDFANETNYVGDMVVEIELKEDETEASAKEVTRAIRTAYFKLQQRNRLNIDKALNKTIADNIYALLNISGAVDYEMILSCCANAEAHLGSFFNRIQTMDFTNESGEVDKNIIGVVYDKQTHPVQFGNPEYYSVPCPNRPIITKEYLFNQVASGMVDFRSRVLIKVKPTSKNPESEELKKKIKKLDKNINVADNQQVTAETEIKKIIDNLKESGSKLQLDYTFSDFKAPKLKNDGSINLIIVIKDENSQEVEKIDNQTWTLKLILFDIDIDTSILNLKNTDIGFKRKINNFDNLKNIKVMSVNKIVTVKINTTEKSIEFTPISDGSANVMIEADNAKEIKIIPVKVTGFENILRNINPFSRNRN